MELFFQVIGAVFLSLILTLMLKQGNPGVAGLLSLLTCVLILILAVGQLRPLADFFHVLERIINLDSSLLKTLFKAVGISIIAQIAELICADSGNSAMGKALQLMASAVIICLSIPMITAFLELIEEILKGL